MNVDQVAPDVMCISTPWHTRRANTYVLGTRRLLLVEPVCGGQEEADWWADRVLQWELEGREVLGCVLTHWHVDHFDGANALASRFGWPIWAPLPQERGAPSWALEATRPPGEEIFGWRVLRTPGHAPEHICLTRDGILVAGDMVSEGGAIVLDKEAWETSYRQLEALGSHLVLPSHGRPATTLERS